MATLTKGKTFSNGELVTPQKLHELVDLASITGIVTAEITDSAITTAKLAANSVTTAKIADANVTTAKIADANVTTAKLADSAVTSAKIADGTIVNADISAAAAIALSKLATGALPTGITVASANIVDGTIVNADISAAAAIADTKLATISTAGKVSNSATTAVSTNIANAIVTRDSLGNFSAGTITAALAGNAATATKLATARTITLGGDLSGSVSFDGSANATLTAAVLDDSHNHVISNIDGLQTALDGKQANLGFTPVQQGGGTNQGTNKVYIGWNSPNLRVQVDSTDFSGTWPINISGTANPTAHTHDDRYYTETEVNTLLTGKQAAGSYAPATGIAPSAIAGTAVITTDSRLSDARTPTAHTHTIANVTGLQTALDGKQASGSYAPATHTHQATEISGRFTAFQFGPSGEIASGGFEQTTAMGTTVISDAGRNSVPGAILARWQRTNNSGVTSIIGTITSAGSGASTTGVAYNTTSDYRLKSNIEPLTNAVVRLLQIPVHRFNWLADPDAPKVDGFLAHEAQAIVPEAVTGTKDEVDAEGTPIHQGIDQSKLVPLLVAAVQELAARVAALEAR